MSSFAVLNTSIAYLLYRKDFFVAITLGAVLATVIDLVPSLLIEQLVRGCLLVAWMVWLAVIVVHELKKDQVVSLQEGVWYMLRALQRAWWFLVLSLIITFCMTVTLYMPTPDHENIGVIITLMSLCLRGVQTFFNTALVPLIALGSYAFYATVQKAAVFVYRNFFSIAALLLTFLIIILVVYAVTGLINLVMAMTIDTLFTSCYLKLLMNNFIFQWGLFFIYALLAIAQVHFYRAFSRE